MANDLTGDFDVVVQFSAASVDRLLAAMHGIKRFPHSVSLRIDDRPPRPGHQWPSAVEVVDAFGDSVVDPLHITDVGPVVTTNGHGLHAIVNPEVLGDLFPLTPSLLHGRAQVQLGPPLLEIVDAATSRIRVRIPTRARYQADPGTPQVAEFSTGDLVLTTSVSQISSQVGNVIEIDLRGNAVSAAFEPSWSSKPFSAEERTSINRLITNTMRSSTLPSNTPLPAGIGSMRFKAMTTPTPAVAALLTMTGPPGSPSSVHRVFLNGSGFAFGVGIDMLRAAFQPVFDTILSTPIPPFEVSITGPNPTYHVVLRSGDLLLRPGKIVVVITGRATTPAWYAPNFNFTATQEFTLQPNGSSADLVVGALSIDTNSWIADHFRDKMANRFRPIRDRALAQSDAAGKVRRMVDTNRALGGLLRSLLTPSRPDDQPQPPPLGAALAYDAVEIEPSGIILRGQLMLADWGSPHVEFQEIPAPPNPIAGPPTDGPAYSAFKSWIAGGVIDTFEWKRAFDTGPGFRDSHRFIKFPPPVGVVSTEGLVEAAAAPGLIAGYRPMCLTIIGRRLTPAGPVAAMPVTASYCAFHWFPIIDVALDQIQSVPTLALTHRGATGLVQVAGRAAAVRADKARTTPNLIVHFGTVESAGALDRVVSTLAKIVRDDTPAAVVAILDARELLRARHVEGVVYAEADPRWQKLWKLDNTRPPYTAVIDTSGKVAWQHGGDLDAERLAEVLKRSLKPSRFAGGSIVMPRARIGHAPPNFVFPYAKGHDLTLRKLAGQPVVLEFAGPDAIKLRIRERAPIDVPDPKGAIARAYGVAAWPTTIAIDSTGVVREVHHGDLHAGAARGK